MIVACRVDWLSLVVVVVVAARVWLSCAAAFLWRFVVAFARNPNDWA